MNLRNLTNLDLNKTVWRYMPFSKFISLITYKALWFSKLNILQDEYEGMIPSNVRTAMNQDNQKWKSQFNTPEFHRQIDNWPAENENDGRELIVVNCWFLGDEESKIMWNQYGKFNEAVAIKTTIGQLAHYVLMPDDDNISHIGLVSYVDHDNHKMSFYEANQAHERAFLKDTNRFSHEQELRLCTMSLKTTNCISMEGRQYTREEVESKKMNNFNNPGLYIGVKLKELITEIVVCPNAQDWFTKMVARIVDLNGLNAKVSLSKLDGLQSKK
ncbi:hypothetical protein ER57_03940 [Smithella sp. SCADC]|jgi:hypothetical protein|nr:hypothetical protein ER57_03940 [Smithella sp. SCADC]